MAVNYKKLWGLLIDKDLKKDSGRVAGISSSTFVRLGKGKRWL